MKAIVLLFLIFLAAVTILPKLENNYSLGIPRDTIRSTLSCCKYGKLFAIAFLLQSIMLVFRGNVFKKKKKILHGMKDCFYFIMGYLRNSVSSMYLHIS